jgi:transcriptional regulator with XRE-family HTH domain
MEPSEGRHLVTSAAEGSFGEVLGELLRQAEITPRELERLSGVNQGHISRLLRSRTRSPRPETIHKLAAAFGDDAERAKSLLLAAADRPRVDVDREARRWLPAFGNPDGAGVELGELAVDLVRLDPNLDGGVGRDLGDLRARIIVGPKGSGKTTYLRLARARARAESSFYTDTVQREPPRTEAVVRFSVEGGDRAIADRWQLFWRRAIQRSVVTHILNAAALSTHLSSADLEQFRFYASELSISSREPASITSSANTLLYSFDDPRRLDRHLVDERWDDLEVRLGSVFHSLPPMFFFIDSIDEAYDQAPRHWLLCQEGLFYAVMALLRDVHLGSRLHIMIAIRDHVFYHAIAGEHRTRLATDPHIRMLNWDNASLLRVLSEKASRLPTQNLLRPDLDDPIERWIGRMDLEDTNRSITEPVTSYIMRHIRKSPRDLIIVGNLLSELVVRWKGDSEALPTEIITEQVRTAGRLFGEEAVSVCVNHLASEAVDEIPSHSRSLDYSGLDSVYRESVSLALNDAISSIGTSSFNHEQLVEAQTRMQEAIGTRVNLVTILWQSGLVGYRTDGGDSAVFFQPGKHDELYLPGDRGEYVFHQCLVDAYDLPQEAC